jgi:hypothetical protein
LEEAGNIHSTLPKKFITYTEVLEKAGYTIGFTGKGWSPGRLAAGGRDSNPAVQEFGKRRLKPPFRGMRNTDYAANFDDFLGQLLLGNSFGRPPWRAVREAGKVGVRGAEGVRFHCNSHWPEDWRMLRAEVEEKGADSWWAGH